MKNYQVLITVVILLLLILSCDNSDESSKMTEFVLINEISGKNVFNIQFNTNDELLIGTSNNGIYIFNEDKNELKEVIKKDEMWNIQNHKISIGKSIVVHYHRDFPQTYKSTDDGYNWSPFFIEGNIINEYSPIASGSRFFAMNLLSNKVNVFNSNFNSIQPIEIHNGTLNSIYPWYDSHILIKKELSGNSIWSIYNYDSKTDMQIVFNQPGDYRNFLFYRSNIIAYKIQGDKLFQSNDSGKVFNLIPNLPASTIHDVKILNDMLYIASDKGVFRTDNYGINWETIYSSEDEPICIAMNSKNKLYIVTSQNKVFREKI
ncbi:hypothetical protein MASR1M45_05350 [Candidatus Kapaibacterium sp.]